MLSKLPVPLTGRTVAWSACSAKRFLWARPMVRTSSLLCAAPKFTPPTRRLKAFQPIHDDALGLFCYARLEDGRFESTGIPVTRRLPSGVKRHATESDEVRKQKIQERTLQMERRSRAYAKGGVRNERDIR